MEELIEKVREREELYNTNHPEYMLKSLKDAVWQKIAEELNYKDGEQVKKLWLKLRNCHRDALRRKNKCGNIIPPKTWKYEHHMKFLLKYMFKTTTMLNAQNSTLDEINQTKNGSKHINENEEENADTKTDVVKVEPDDIEPECTLDSDGYSSETYIYMYDENKVDNSFEGGISNLKKEANKSNSAETKTHENQAKGIATRCQNNDDELYHFYMSMYGMTKKLPLDRQLNIKKKIFEIVAEEQEQEFK